MISNKYIIKKNFLFFVSPVYIKLINENIKIWTMKGKKFHQWCTYLPDWHSWWPITQPSAFSQSLKLVWKSLYGLKLLHHHHIFICLIYTIQKKLFTAVIARRRGDPGSHWAYGRATSLTLINKVKKKCCKCAARPIQGLFK